ncbi:Succinyl-CoA--L-malate CoA-transferase beta subunit [Methylobacterium crusticola]|uniref:Succinyl-CoA--L-malate CoA-transferase beta subunit n=1 Tax=Methylobacterium crusticola TaxID=1697972 RepID=A0ABQ4R4V3_9HYPH|nr:CoA transferase [Methylobacterium crusticola]GJD52164.1 Succinyl-CoA--L-malate CoA-transferase beta subunit [Methylobacterium crusticola]
MTSQKPAGAGTPAATTGPLRGLKVLELGHFIAAPFCTRILADHGADVIKVEPPAGEPLRTWGVQSRGHSVIWSLHNRNKRCVTLDMKAEASRPAIERLVRWADVVVENFRPGQLERWGLGFADLQRLNPRIILARISGYGQTGPYKDRHSFGAIGEAMGGIRYLTGFPEEQVDLPSVRTGISLGDDITALYAVAGVLSAVYERDVAGTGIGREVDIALYEGVFSLLEGILPEYGTQGSIRRPQGSAMPTAVPSDTYRSADGQWLVIAGNSDPIFVRLCTLMGRPDMASDPRLRTNVDRLRHRAEVDGAIADWAATLPAREAERRLNAAGIPASRTYTVADCAADPHFQAREMICEVQDPLIGPTLHPGVIPRFDEAGARGSIAWPGAPVGAHNDQVYVDLLGFTRSDVDTWRRETVI